MTLRLLIAGGGTGGQFMFASIAELDAVIAQWEKLGMPR